MTTPLKPLGYEKQDRGSRSGYARYWAGMNARARPKAALTAAVFRDGGTLVDLGSGTGLIADLLAHAYPHAKVIGVDIDPKAVAHAQETYRTPNLEFVLGDAGGPLFPDGSVDHFNIGSTFHHFTSYNGHDEASAHRALDAIVRAMKVHGTTMMGDFVVPDGPPLVQLDLPTTDGAEEGAPPALSTAALFRRFARDFRSMVNPGWEVPHQELESPREGFRRFVTSSRDMTEFVLHKDYRESWEVEVREAYLIWGQARWEQEMRRRGVRVLSSLEIRNPWIYRQRWNGKFFVSDLAGKPVQRPATNYALAVEKVGAGEGVELRDAVSRRLSAPKFLQPSSFRHRDSGQVYDLISRPGEVVDFVPWFEEDGQLWVLAKEGFPRPIVNARTDSPEILRSTVAGYITETICASAEGDRATPTLAARAGLSPDEILEASADDTYYPSPGGIAERVTARRVRIRPRHDVVAVPNYTDLQSSGRVRAMPAEQVLWGAQVGSMFEARLEINTYELMLEQGRPVGPWIGGDVALTDQRGDGVTLARAAEALSPPARAAFEPMPPGEGGTFLEVRAGEFIEDDARGEPIARSDLEYVVPRTASLNTLVTLPVMRCDGRVVVGLEARDLPGPQQLSGSSAIVTTPAFRAPRAVTNLDEARAFVEQGMQQHFGARVRDVWDLGGKYFPSPGVTPERVLPWGVEIDAASASDPRLTWAPLDELVASRGLIHDAHTRLAVLRAAHATGLLAV